MGNSERFDGLDFTVGEAPRDDVDDDDDDVFFDIVEPVFLPVVINGVRVGVADIGAEALEAGVDEREPLVGVEDRAWGLEDGNVERGVGVEAREGFGFSRKVGRAVGVAALRAGLCFSDDKGLMFAPVDAGSNSSCSCITNIVANPLVKIA